MVSSSYTSDEGGVLPLAVARNLGDKTVEKRKSGALEVEIAVRDLYGSDHHKVIREIIACLRKDFLESPSPHQRKGGLLGLAAVSVGLGDGCTEFLDELVEPVVIYFIDPDARTRYHASEAMYNVAKIARTHLLPRFEVVFEGLFKLSADPSEEVRRGMTLLDRLMKDIVAESNNFDMYRFVPELINRLSTPSANARQFLIAWMQALNEMPGVDMIPHIPTLLNSLFVLLGEQKTEIRQMAYFCLKDMLDEIKEKKARADFVKMTQTLVEYCRSKDAFIHLTAIQWLAEFVVLAHALLLPYISSLLTVVLPSVSHMDDDIAQTGAECSDNLQILVRDTADTFDLAGVFHVLILSLEDPNVLTRRAALGWVNMIVQKCPQEVVGHLDQLFPALLKTLSDDADEVVSADLEVLSRLSADSKDHFKRCINELVDMFKRDQNLLKRRGPLIVRKLCVYLGADDIYTSLASILENRVPETAEDVAFNSLMIKHLNLILVTSVELETLRDRLMSCHVDPAGRRFFLSLFPSWCHNPISTLCLCLLAQAYEISSELITVLSRMQINMETLLQMDKLIQLIESPIFMTLRVHLLDRDQHPYLPKTLYGLLMLMPQSSAFNILKNRLSCVPPYPLPAKVLLAHDSTNGKSKSKSKVSPDSSQAMQPLSTHDMLRVFKEVQEGARQTVEKDGGTTAL